MSFEQVKAYLEKSLNAFYNHAVMCLTSKEFNKTVRIHIKPKNNKLNLDIIFIISRLFTPSGYLVTRLTLVYAWWMGRGYWEKDLPQELILDQKNLDQWHDFVDTYLRDFELTLTNEIFVKLSGRYRNLKFLDQVEE